MKVLIPFPLTMAKVDPTVMNGIIKRNNLPAKFLQLGGRYADA